MVVQVTDSSSNSKRVVVFFTFDVSLKTWVDRGMFSRETKLYQELIARGWQVTFITYGDKEDIELARGIPNIKVIPLYDRHYQSKSLALRLLLSPFLVLKVRKEIQQATLLKTNQIWGSWIAVLSMWLYKKPLIARGGYEPYIFAKNLKQSKARLLIWKLVCTLAYRMADKIVMATSEDKNFIVQQYNINSAKIVISPNWIDVTLFQPTAVKKLQNHILFVGRFTQQKNLENLIRAISGTELTLHLVGNGELIQSLERIVVETGAKVEFLGQVPNDQLPALYNKYPVFVQPSHLEGNPKTLLEAMSCGVAVVGTNVFGIRNLITDRINGLLAGTDTIALRAALLEISTDKDLQESTGRAAREFILAHNTLATYVETELSIYDQLIS